MRSLLLLLLVNIAWAQVDELYLIAGHASQTRYSYISETIYESFKDNPSITSMSLANPIVPYEWVEDAEGNWIKGPKEDWDHIGATDNNPDTPSTRVFTQTEIDAMWEFGPPLMRITEPAQIERALASSKTGITARRPLIFINNHGGAPRDQKDDVSISRDTETGIAEARDATVEERMSATVSMTDSDKSFDMDQLHDIIKNQFDSNDLIRMIGIQCFSGGIHEISFKESNTCTAASTDWLTVTTSFSSRNKYGEGIAIEKAASATNKKFDLDKNGETSLQEAHLAGLAHDELNWGRGQLSSMAYVDMILEEGAYAETVSREYYNPDDDPDINKISTDCITCKNRFGVPNIYSTAIRNFEQLEKRLRKGLFVPQFHKLTFQEEGRLPAPMRNTYKNLLTNDRFKTLQINVENQIDEKQERYESQMAIVADIRFLAMSPAIPLVVREEYKEKLEEEEEKLTDIRNEIEELITPLRGINNYFIHVKKVARFMETATWPQMNKFAQLQRCEQEPL